MATAIPRDTDTYSRLLANGKVPYRDTKEYNASMAAGGGGPQIVVMMLGTNDANSISWRSYRSEYKRSYLSLIDSYKSLESKPKVFIMVPPPQFVDGAYDL